MPTYCYKCETCSESTEDHRSMSDKGGTPICPTCDQPMIRDWYQESTGRVEGRSTYPMESYAAGCNPDEVAVHEGASVAMGVPTHFNPSTGDAVFRNAKHRKEYCEAVGLYDRNAGHSDPQPKNR